MYDVLFSVYRTPLSMLKSIAYSVIRRRARGCVDPTPPSRKILVATPNTCVYCHACGMIFFYSDIRYSDVSGRRASYSLSSPPPRANVIFSFNGFTEKKKIKKNTRIGQTKRVRTYKPDPQNVFQRAAVMTTRAHGSS